MAGAGYKLFNTGDVLTAAQVNTYLMEQTVMVFADAAARTTALTGVVSEGMISYLKDTNAVEVYNGSAWVSSDDPNAIQNTIVDAKGDLITATASDVPARLAVGNNGETLVADSSTTTGLRWQADFAAGKNKIINGAFDWNQRAFTSNTASGSYNFDRWRQSNGGTSGTLTTTPQTFTLGAAPVAGYEATNFLQAVTASGANSNTFAAVEQRLEDVRTFAGQTATFSFWAKATSGTPKIALELSQNFGSGGSPSSAVSTAAGNVTISTSWARYSITVAVPSISGKTLGTTANTSYLAVILWLSGGSDFDSRTGSIGLQNNTFQIWGVQAEVGSVATAFQTATGTLAGELAACQRYYYRWTPVSAGIFGVGFSDTTTSALVNHFFPVVMRTAPTALEQSGTASDYTVRRQGGSVIACNSVPTFGATSTIAANIQLPVASGLTAGEGSAGRAANTSAYLGWSAEL